MRTHLRLPIPAAAISLGLLVGLAGCGGPGEEPISGRFVPVAAGAPLRHLLLEGSPTAMGRAQGRLLKDEVRVAASRPLPESLRPSLEQYARSMRPLAPAALLEELDAMAKEAGVLSTDLFLREAAREGLRWHEAEGEARSAAFASAPGPSSDVVVAFDGADLEAKDWIVIERHPRDGAATLSLVRPGEIGAIGGVTMTGSVIVGGEIGLLAERRTLRGPPFAWSLRAALESEGSLEHAMGRLASLCGHRVLGADAANRRFLTILTLAADPPKAFDGNTWVLAAAGPDDGPTARAQEDRLASYPARSVAADAGDLAVAGRTRDAVGPVARWTRAGLRFGTFDYVWSPD